MLAVSASAQDQKGFAPTGEEIDRIAEELPQMMLHPLYDEPYMCSEHPFSTSMQPGNTLAQDCMIMDGIDWVTNTGFMQFYSGDGSRNEDWYGWGKPVLAPLAGTVTETYRVDTVNEPGTMTPGMATYVTITAAGGESVMIVHLGEIAVEEGQSVAVGDVVGTVGNNGNSRSPHIHVGAIDAEGEPAQIRWNLVTAALRARDYVMELRKRADAESGD
ncbi:M23 family metallopeptidase [Alteriqipengyuania sp. WL0013]|uniref:M23 family metallopeptidase n=1 Tax=Alteriqipengyuania sp. WL0013 TaxID=3110773 RepID=UPI002C38E421|nr:M23 family metallopeptidase [Alteriqipengyuania sp. WL0013]MEB3416641.1 M23 family metallopeptidase [Alteriqipengyuania sp. WL0013]